MKHFIRFAAEFALFPAIFYALFSLASPFLPSFNRLLINDPVWGILSVWTIFAILLIMTFELHSMICGLLWGNRLIR